jgi:hypothetical protein
MAPDMRIPNSFAHLQLVVWRHTAALCLRPWVVAGGCLLVLRAVQVSGGNASVLHAWPGREFDTGGLPGMGSPICGCQLLHAHRLVRGGAHVAVGEL